MLFSDAMHEQREMRGSRRNFFIGVDSHEGRYITSRNDSHSILGES
jgi:hypothetical protein